MMILSSELTWRVVLITAVFGADLLVFIGLCCEELRDWRVSRYYPTDEPVAKVVSVTESLPRTRQVARGSAIVEQIAD
jgi:hypothetical protein